jgi:D-alanyl-D-alanine carboxypeptidase
MKKLILYLLVITAITSSSNSNAFSQTFPSKDSLIAMLTGLKEETKVNALMTGIWEGDKEILTLALGESMTSVPATTDMHIRIGGISETFFGTLMMLLSEKGIINLDDKVSKWLPDLLAADSVTVRMLVQNTSGYKDYVHNKDFVNLIIKEPFKQISRDDILSAATADGQLDFSPGTKQSYSHTNFTVVGKIVEMQTGKTMADLYEEYIFRPLGLENTGCSRIAELPCPVLHAFSKDRSIYEDATFWCPSWVGDSGPIYSTLQDIGKWSPKFGKGALLSKASFNELISRPKGITGINGTDVYMGSGFVVLNGWYAQNPSMNGYRGGYGYYPDKELTIVVFTTESETSGDDNFAFQIFKELVKKFTPEAAIKF